MWTLTRGPYSVRCKGTWLYCVVDINIHDDDFDEDVNRFTANCGQMQISTKFPNFVVENFEKQIASCESIGRELSFEWSHHRISSTDSKVRVTLQNSIKHSGSEGVND